VHLTYAAIALSLLVTALPPGSVPDAGPGGNARARLFAYLETHDVPAAAELRALAPAPDALLMSIVDDTRAGGLVRSRAVAALRLLPSPAVQGFLGKLVAAKARAKDATDRLIVRRAAVALGWMAAPNAAAQLATLFANDDAEVRLDAAIGLGLTRTEDAAVILNRQLAVETDARVRDQIQRQLHALGPLTPKPEKPPAPTKKPPMRSSF